ncbi:class I SAM-dependent methyltransferase [Burkholderia thailandensis]|nr:class I SAM-dependent methyltransferase [Burkholderia thailandensis]MCS3394037.1 class I SAM-dependent methyltransferase [Burkholderia thailandensis]MCS6427140.1 class I SAM-dependent methyltransferase [Burkholderia thailandensis]MCS6455410.1 class I SAM-dependent methyltransferase [Burkholderia thailandensis]MCS6466363.1 class I SAM-dependent methyltransferase [Burkholderia thailandensis]MCS6485010.1 class I SAM-dependent methyltransferase [Burkholderia thailandensis]
MLYGDTMTNAISRHYDTLLAEHYTWMFGMPFRSKVEEQRELLETLGMRPGKHGTALDLGCGPGFQSIALANLGFEKVVAIDTSRALLDELNSQKGNLPIETTLADLRDFDRFAVPGSAAAIVCMGDTLTHLDNMQDVAGVFKKARDVLQPSGVLVLTFRDLSIELTGLDRFLPVHADNDRIMTCMLEYRSDIVVVNDLIHVRESGGWTLRKSSYQKLRLPPDTLSDELTRLGFTVRTNEPFGRMHACIAEK